jgi:predicted nucleic acid-binding protein
MKVLFDTNVILDVLLARRPHVRAAAVLLNYVDQGKIEGVVCATTVTTLHYLASKAVGAEKAIQHLRTLLEMFGVAAVDSSVLKSALELSFSDFKDAVLHEAGRASGVGAIVTRNTRDFAKATLSILSPDELLAVVIADA